MLPMLLIGITGYTCSGKTRLAILLEKKGFTRINLGDITRRLAKEKGLSITRHETWKFFKIMTERDPYWRVGYIANLVREGGSEKIVLDGVRIPEEARELKNLYGESFLLVETKVDEKTRLKRSRSRKRDIDPSKWDEEARKSWLKMDSEEREMIDKLRPFVDFTVIGEGIK